jgi:cell division protease FtsH
LPGADPVRKVSIIPRMAGTSDAMLDAVDEEVRRIVRRIVDECYAEARRLLRANRDRLDAIVKELLVRETLDEPDVYAAAGIARPTAGGGAIARAAVAIASE